jgi:hypothetical protein
VRESREAMGAMGPPSRMILGNTGIRASLEGSGRHDRGFPSEGRRDPSGYPRRRQERRCVRQERPSGATRSARPESLVLRVKGFVPIPPSEPNRDALSANMARPFVTGAARATLSPSPSLPRTARPSPPSRVSRNGNRNRRRLVANLFRARPPPVSAVALPSTLHQRGPRGRRAQRRRAPPPSPARLRARAPRRQARSAGRCHPGRADLVCNLARPTTLPRWREGRAPRGRLPASFRADTDFDSRQACNPPWEG